VDSLDDEVPVDVSVLVMTYNHAPYIAECLDSLLAQDYEGRVEILVGEDCSTDGTAAIVAKYAASHPEILVVTADHNVGMHENHRRLVRTARGRYVAYCEGDDFWHEPGKLSLQVAYLDAFPEFAGVHSDVDHAVLHNGHWRVMKRYWASTGKQRKHPTTFHHLLARNTVQTCSVVLRTPLVQSFLSSSLESENFAVGDWPLFLFVTSNSPIALLTESLATYRRVEGSATNRGAIANEERILDQFRMIRLASSLVQGAEAARHAGYRNTLSALLVNALSAGDRAMANRAFAAGDKFGVTPTLLQRAVVSLMSLRVAAGLFRGMASARAALMIKARYH